MDFDRSTVNIVLIIIGIIISLAVHETMHAWAGLKLGDSTAQDEGRISFNPLAHIDPVMTIALPIATIILFGVPILAAKPVPFDPGNVKWGEYGGAIIAFAGPFSNIVMALISALLMRFVFSDPGFLTDALTLFAKLNVGIFVFNMVPIPPLDGSRILFAFAPEVLQKVMIQMESFGLFIVFALVLGVPGFGEILVNLSNSILRFIL